MEQAGFALTKQPERMRSVCRSCAVFDKIFGKIMFCDQPRVRYVVFLFCLIMLAGCRRPAPLKRSVDPGQTIFFVPTAEKIVALTFDDGPSDPATGMILDALRAHNVKATFFLIGANVERHPEIARRIGAEGHLIGNHTYRHMQFDQHSASEIAEDITKGSRAIQAITGLTPKWFRPPFGINGPGMETACRIGGMAIAGWSADASDWNPHPVEALVERIVSQAIPGDIILLHDGWETRPDANRQRTVAAVPLIIERLLAKGYRFVTLDELVRSAGRPMAEFANGARLLGMQIPVQPAQPGELFAARYFWEVPTEWGSDAPSAFVHFLDGHGRRQFQDDHNVPPRGDVRDLVVQRKVRVPADALPGKYRVAIGLFHPNQKPARRVALRASLRCAKNAVIIPDALQVERSARTGEYSEPKR